MSYPPVHVLHQKAPLGFPYTDGQQHTGEEKKSREVYLALDSLMMLKQPCAPVRIIIVCASVLVLFVCLLVGLLFACLFLCFLFVAVWARLIDS